MSIDAKHPYHPIIYVRGFAALQSEIEDAVSDPYMGFNIGATKSRMAWTGDVNRFFFESPLVRLMREQQYDDVYVDGQDLVTANQPNCKIPYRSIIIYRYYDEASKVFGSGDTPPIEHFAKGLGELILNLREKICSNPENEVTPSDFRVHLVAHSMGGLICRAFLQNSKLGKKEARAAVDKLFTYATPHNGIDMRIVRNVPGWLTFGDINNFNRDRMAKYLAVPEGDDVSIVKNFPPERVFNLVGTNCRDYSVPMSSWAAGEASDGLVRIENATTHGKGADGSDIESPRAFVHRSHSGHFGIVNSEEGYQNLTRFLFGSLRADGIFDIDEITLPEEVQAKHDAGEDIKASYQFEVSVSVRGGHWQLTRREVRDCSAIFRQYDELFPKKGKSRKPNRDKSPHLFSVFLDPEKSTDDSGSVSFSFDLRVLVPDYEVNGILFMKRHYEGGYILRKCIIVEANPDEEKEFGWRINYGFQDETPGLAPIEAETYLLEDEETVAFDIRLEQTARPGIRGTLRVEVRLWS
ncbi:MAG: hypothetical protein RBU21_16355 [FCB group bacterium]|jgi:hypothetical protein|nr:hypothetical protein [FCB group bacterium]